MSFFVGEDGKIGAGLLFSLMTLGFTTLMAWAMGCFEKERD